MTQIDIWYEGDLSTRCVHSGTQVEICTDAPKEFHGLGNAFSPTDLFAAALGACVITLMGMIAAKLHIDLMGTHASVSKEMTTIPPRRVAKLVVTIRSPHVYSEEVTSKLIAAGEGCPVHKSLHPDIQVEFVYLWGQA